MVTKILVLSDAHIHDRADEIPKPLLDIIEQERPFDISVYAGDFTDEDIYRWFKETGRKTYEVQGNMDYLDLPEYATFVLPILNVKIGVIHGHQVRPRGNIVQLTEIAKRLGANILISGHTHAPLVRVFENVLHLNPGSATGAWGGGGGTGKPSMIIMKVSDIGIEIMLYELEKGNQVKTSLFRFAYRGGNWVPA